MFSDPLLLVALHVFAAAILRLVRPNVVTALILAVVMISSTGVLGSRYGDEALRGFYRTRDKMLTLAGEPPGWPPEKHRTYPDLELLGLRGQPTRLSDFQGRVILLETVGLSCRASVSFAGGHACGPFGNVAPQPDLESLAVYTERFAGVRLDDPRLLHVQLLLFNRQMQSPTLEEVQQWAWHFQSQRPANSLVLFCGTPELASSATREIVPGFHLIDRQFVLRADSTGQTPEDDLFRELLPKLADLLEN
jgi:hypothetical protein